MQKIRKSKQTKTLNIVFQDTAIYSSDVFYDYSMVLQCVGELGLYFNKMDRENFKIKGIGSCIVVFDSY